MGKWLYVQLVCALMGVSLSAGSLWASSIETSEKISNFKSSTSTWSQDEQDFLYPRKKLYGEWSLSLGGKTANEGLDEGSWAFIKMAARGEMLLKPELLFLRGDLKFTGRSGQNQARFKELQNDSWNFKEFVAALRPLEVLELQAGAVNQKFLRNRMLVSKDRAFAGLKQELSFQQKFYGIRAITQQSIPSSSSLNTNLSEKEPVPSFFTESAEINLRPTKNIEWDIYGTYFRFKKLPSVVAEASGLAGNTTNGETAPAAEFQYEFDGVSFGSDLCYCNEDSFSLVMGTQLMQNFAARDKSDRSQNLFFGARFGGTTFAMEPKVDFFFIESDVAPAYYGARDRGYANRKGTRVGLDFFFEDLGFKIKTFYVVADEINDNLLQDRLQAIEVKVETYYVAF